MYVLSGFDVVEATPLYITFVSLQFPPSGQFSLSLQLHSILLVVLSLLDNIFLLCLFMIVGKMFIY